MFIDLTAALRTARRERESIDSDMAPVLWFNRGGDLVARVDCPQVDRDVALMAANIGIEGYRPDNVIVSLDDHPVTDSAEFVRQVGSTAPDRSVTVSLLRSSALNVRRCRAARRVAR